MSEYLRAPRGTTDILPNEQHCWRHFHRVAVSVADRFSCERIDTPMFEHTELFKRSIGTDTDIVMKEMYTFEDHRGSSLTLRPEGTAGVCRAYIEHALYNLPQPIRLYYIAPMFRYERPQAGRFRQFNQFGVEVIGDASPTVDAEVIELAWVLIRELGIPNTNLRINSIGDPTDRAAYSDAIRSYYSPFIKKLPYEAQERFNRSPMRMLDAKEDYAREWALNAPHALDYASCEARSHFSEVLQLLDALSETLEGFSYTVDHTLVRGLDYYNRTVFEVGTEQLSTQSAFIGGGRYDPLIHLLRGPDIPAVGLAAGVERILRELNRLDTIDSPSVSIDSMIVTVDGNVVKDAFVITSRLRAAGLKVVLAPPRRSLKAQMKYAAHSGAAKVIIFGSRDLERGIVVIRDMDKGEQREISADYDVIYSVICEDKSIDL